MTTIYIDIKCTPKCYLVLSGKRRDKIIEINKIYNADCMSVLQDLEPESVNLALTDTPYGEVNRDSNGLRTLNKENADIMTFNLDEFLKELYRVTKGTIIIFCGQHQFSDIKKFLHRDKHRKKELFVNLSGRKQIQVQ